jgi:hypothetical protein
MLAEQPPRAVIQALQMPVEITAPAAGDAQRGEHPERGSRPG